MLRQSCVSLDDKQMAVLVDAAWKLGSSYQVEVSGSAWQREERGQLSHQPRKESVSVGKELIKDMHQAHQCIEWNTE